MSLGVVFFSSEQGVGEATGLKDTTRHTPRSPRSATSRATNEGKRDGNTTSWPFPRKGFAAVLSYAFNEVADLLYSHISLNPYFVYM